MEFYQVERRSTWEQEQTHNNSKPKRRSPLLSYNFSNTTSFRPNIQDFSVWDQQGQHFFRFQLVNAATITCSTCFRHYFLSLIGISPQYQIPNQVECSHCRQLIEIPELITSQNNKNSSCIIPEDDNGSNLYHPITRMVNTDPAGMLDIEAFLLKYGRYFTSQITTVSFMRIKLPKLHISSGDSWGLVLTCLTDQTLRIHTVDTTQLASLDLKALYFRSSESSSGLSEIMLRDSNNKQYILNAAATHKWFKYHLINKMNINTIKLENALHQFHTSKPPSIVEKPTKTGFLSRIRKGAFKKKESSPDSNSLAQEEPPNEELASIEYFKSQKIKNHPILITLLPSTRKSVPNILLHYSDSPSRHSRIPSGTFTASSFSSDELVSNSPHSELGLEFYYQNHLSTKPNVPHNHWLPGFPLNYTDSRSGEVSFDTVPLYPCLTPINNNITPVPQTNNESNSDLSLLIDQFPTPPTKK